jgi:transketolase
MIMSTAVTHADLANAIRFLAVDAVDAAKSGHQGMPMGMADAATVLFTQFLKFDPADPSWPDRDRFVLSAGHGSMLLYAALHLTGYADFSIEEVKRFRQWGAKTAGHPEFGHGAGVETTTGPLGQGIATAVGMAMAERMMNARFGDALVDHHTYVIASDGDLMEGISQEAIALAGHQQLSKLIVLFDDNAISIDGGLDLADSTDQLTRFEASGWRTVRIDGHDPAALTQALSDAKSATRPTLIACRTVIGYGASAVAGTAKAHGYGVTGGAVADMRRALCWPHAPFEIPAQILTAWRAAGARGGEQRAAWRARLAGVDAAASAAFEAAVHGRLPEGLGQAVRSAKQSLIAAPKAQATRQHSGDALELLTDLVPHMVGGSADLTGSNNTRTRSMSAFSPGDRAGRFVHYGVREHAMAAAMNGLALHGGIIPYSGTFLVFADYMRPALRLAALMKQRVIHVLTHDSIGLGEDGPTHQPIEHLAALRAMPNLFVFRPADAVETLEAWEIMLSLASSPSVIALTRQKVANARTTHTEQNLVALGAYVLRAATAPERVALLATGSEVDIALSAQALLEAQGVGARVVSMPCWELFERQSPAYQADVLGAGLVRIGVEAAVRMGWERWLGADGRFVGLCDFGASAPYETLYEKFAITPEEVAAQARAALGL